MSLTGKPTAGTGFMATGYIKLGYIKKITVQNQGNTGDDTYPSSGKTTDMQVQKPSLKSNR